MQRCSESLQELISYPTNLNRVVPRWLKELTDNLPRRRSFTLLKRAKLLRLQGQKFSVYLFSGLTNSFARIQLWKEFEAAWLGNNLLCQQEARTARSLLTDQCRGTNESNSANVFKIQKQPLITDQPQHPRYCESPC